MFSRAHGRRGQQRLEHVHAAVVVKVLHHHAVKTVEHGFPLQITIHACAADDRVSVVNAHAQIVFAGVIEHPRRNVIRQYVFIHNFIRLHVGDACAIVADGIIAVFRQLQLADIAPHAARRPTGSQRDRMAHLFDFQNRLQRFGRDILLRIGQRAVDIQHEQFPFFHVSYPLRRIGALKRRSSPGRRPPRASARFWRWRQSGR